MEFMNKLVFFQLSQRDPNQSDSKKHGVWRICDSKNHKPSAVGIRKNINPAHSGLEAIAQRLEASDFHANEKFCCSELRNEQ